MDILGEDESGGWAAFESALLIPRQNGKGAVLEALELADLFLFCEGQRDFLVIHTAHEFKTAQEAFRRVQFWVENTDWMRKKVKGISTAHGSEGIELLSGARLRFLARSKGSGRGFSADRLIYDEAYDLPEETVAASLPTLSARRNPSVVYTSSAPLDKPESRVLRRVVARGRCEGDAPKDANLCYIEFSADPKADLDDRGAWVQANPSSQSDRGVPSMDFIAKERSAMSDVQFARERLGILDESAGATVVDMAQWESLGDPLSSAVDPVAFAVDVAPDGAFASIGMAGRRADGQMHVEVVAKRRGTGWVVDAVSELVENWSPCSVTLDAIGLSGALLPGFAEAGISVDVVSTKEYGQACAAFKTLVDEGGLVHKTQPGLSASVEAARQRKLNNEGAWAWNRRDSTDITPLVAVTLAVFGFSKHVGGAVEAQDTRVIIFR